MEKILNAAQYLFEEYKKLAGETIDQMKLHKLLYFAQRESFAITGKPLFSEELEGWKYGPVSPKVRAYFTEDGIAAPTEEPSLEGAYILKNILLEYGPIASWKLSQMSHKEQSWINARSGLGPEEVGNVPLSLEDIQRDAEKVRPYDHMWDMYYDEFEDLEAEEGGGIGRKGIPVGRRILRQQDEDYEEERPPGFGCGRAQKQRLHCTADFHH